jgi:hypothetical protein
MLVLAAATAGADPQADCERRFAKDPRADFACGCFYSLGSRGGAAGDAALDLLAGHLRRDPDNACLLFNLGRLERQLRRDGAEEHLAAAAAAYAAADRHEGETYARLNLGDLLAGQGRLPAAEKELVAAAAAAARVEGKDYLAAEVEVRRAGFQLQRGEDLEQVELLLRQAEKKAFPGGHDSLQRDTLQSLGDVLHQLGRRDEAEAAYRRMIEVTLRKNSSGHGDRYGEAAARHNLALAAMSRPPSAANAALAATRFEEALAAAVAGHHLRIEADARRWLGRLRGGPEGIGQLERSLELAATAEDEFLLRLGLGALAAEVVEQDPRRAAELAARAAGIELELELALYGWLDRLKVSWAVHGRQEAARLAMDELHAIEKLRGRQQDSLTRAELFSVWADAYSWLAGQLLEEGTAGPVQLEAAFELLERRHARSLLETVAAPAGAAPSFATLRETQAALAADEAFLYFQQAHEKDAFGDFAGGSWLLVLTRGEARIYRSADPLEIDPLVPTFAGLLAGRAVEGIGAAAANLERALFGRALAELPAGVGRLVLVADEDLQLLPFAALRAEPNGPSLAERYQLAMVPSATLWQRWRAAAQAPAPRVVLVLADPRPGAAAPPLASLPAARREGRNVFRELGGEGLLLLGAEATETALFEAHGPAGLLHFAAHAIHGRAGLRSERSALVLAAGGAAEDGLLQPREIRRLKLERKAVVLAACRGAEGEVLAGEGAVSLANGFFAAGAEVVVAGLWNLEDQAAMRFSERFYRHLGAGQSAGHALAAAQREAIEAGEAAADWAGLLLIGNGDWQIASAPGLPPWTLLSVPALLALVLWAKWRERRDRQR